jgi:Flp pilus assembly protein TadD
VLGYTLSQLGRREEAIRELQTALRLQPNHAQAKQWLGELQR